MASCHDWNVLLFDDFDLDSFCSSGDPCFEVCADCVVWQEEMKRGQRGRCMVKEEYRLSALLPTISRASPFGMPMLAGVIIHRHACVEMRSDSIHSCVEEALLGWRATETQTDDGWTLCSARRRSLARPLVASFSPLSPGAHRSYRMCPLCFTTYVV